MLNRYSKIILYTILLIIAFGKSMLAGNAGTETNINTLNKKGFNDLHIAAAKGDLKQIDNLIKAGANVNIKNTINGSTPLHIAVIRGKIQSVKALLEKDADPDVKTNNGFTPLHVATKLGNIEAAKTLLEKGANPAAKTNSGTTPLDIATKKLNSEIIELLTKYIENQALDTLSAAKFNELIADTDKITDKLDKLNKDIAKKSVFTDADLQAELNQLAEEVENKENINQNIIKAY